MNEMILRTVLLCVQYAPLKAIQYRLVKALFNDKDSFCYRSDRITKCTFSLACTYSSRNFLCTRIILKIIITISTTVHNVSQ